MIKPTPLPEGAKGKLDDPEATLTIGYVFPFPLTIAPPHRFTLIEDTTPAGSSFRIDIDETLRLYFMRQAPGGKPIQASVTLLPLRGVRRIDIACTWSPVGLKVRVVDRDRPELAISSP